MKKITEEQIQKSSKLIHSLITKAWESEDFKKQLINNPVATIESVTGEPLPISAGRKIVVRDQTDENSVYINIPTKVDIDEMELTDAQLEMVAGGAPPDTWNPITWAGYLVHGYACMHYGLC